MDAESCICDADLSCFAQICFCIFCTSLPAFGDLSSLPHGDAGLLSGSSLRWHRHASRLGTVGTWGQRGAGLAARALAARRVYKLLRGNDNPSCEGCPGPPALGISIPVPPAPAAAHHSCPGLGSAISQPFSRPLIPNPLLRMEQVKDEGQHQAVSTPSSFRFLPLRVGPLGTSWGARCHMPRMPQ